jgi:flagellar capping protein FliD
MSSVSSSSNALGIYNSGLPIDDLIAKTIAVEHKPIDLMTTKKKDLQATQNTYSLVQGKVNDLLVAIKKLTTRNIIDKSTIFDGLTGTSSNDQIATATVSGTASPQAISLEVKSLPSQTKAVSTSQVGKFDTSSTLSQLGLSTAGNFTIYSNGTAYNYTYNPTDTVGDVLNKITDATNGVPGITGASVVNGKIAFTYTPGTTLNFGGGSDTLNGFLAKTNLLTAINDGSGNITASQVNTTIDLTQAVSSAAANLNTTVQDGTFSINGVTFDSTGKSLSDIMYEINNSSAGVTANFNKGTNKFELTAKNTGSGLISLSDNSNGGGSSNFLTAMGLIDGVTGNTAASQAAGKNSEFVLNGVTMYATGTTVDETVTGLTGVTLNLKTAQVGTTVTLNVQKDTDSLVSAIKDVVDKYNTAISYIDQQTDAQNKGKLAGESRIIQLRSQIRSLFTTAVSGLSGTSYDSLQQVGISTAKSSGGKASPQLQFDESKLKAALSADASTVKKLFIAQDLQGVGSQGDDGMDGAFTKIYQLLADDTYTTSTGKTGFGALYNGPSENEKGLFFAYQDSVTKRISAMDDSIQKAEDRLSKREETLRQQYLAMDKIIGQYQSQGTAVSNLIQQLSANKS